MRCISVACLCVCLGCVCVCAVCVLRKIIVIAKSFVSHNISQIILFVFPLYMNKCSWQAPGGQRLSDVPEVVPEVIQV